MTTDTVKYQATWDIALGMLRRGECSTDVIVGYLEHTLSGAAEAWS